METTLFLFHCIFIWLVEREILKSKKFCLRQIFFPWRQCTTKWARPRTFDAIWVLRKWSSKAVTSYSMPTRSLSKKVGHLPKISKSYIKKPNSYFEHENKQRSFDSTHADQIENVGHERRQRLAQTQRGQMLLVHQPFDCDHACAQRTTQFVQGTLQFWFLSFSFTIEFIIIY